MSSLLYPAMQKFYSALNSLDKFSKEKDFFENISSLDTFFSEYRNVTFVLQKALAHTDYISIYEKNRQKHLSDCRWFVDKRNETTKQQPFQLVKEIELIIYLPEQSLKVSTMRFTVENDVDMSTLIDQFKQLLTEISPIEVFFSAEFSFYESGSNLDVYNEIMTGIKKLKCFLEDMRIEIKENCELCDKIERQINKFHFTIIPRDMFLITDYVYYPQQGNFERASRVAMVSAENRTTLKRMPLERLYNGALKDMGDTAFEKFIMMHVIIGSSDLMPTIMTIYQDNTFELDAFHSDIKTTVYRKINETANKIVNEDVKEVFLMQTYLAYPSFSDTLNVPAKDRAKLAEKEFLTFMKVDNALNEEEIVFDGANIKCMNYIINQFKHPDKKKLNFGKNNMMPIMKAFKVKLEVSQSTESI
jgi:hypothetical protein